jgi:hypothetical protein
MEQVAKFPQRTGGGQRRAHNEGGTSGIEHPRGQRATTAAFQPDEDDLATGKLLTPMDRQGLAVEGVPSIVDRDYFGLPEMMGIM